MAIPPCGWQQKQRSWIFGRYRWNWMEKNLTLQERRPQAMRAIPTSHTERIYVKVTSDFDSTGYMQPKSITWADGRTFPIDAVRDFRPAGAANNDFSGDCFTVLIQGQEKHLFFEHIDRRFSGRIGRWFVEKAAQ
jgi:hypothetical protein